MNEFDIINHFFKEQTLHRADVILGIGDDCAITQPPKDHELLITTDTLVSGVHFLTNTAAYDIGHKSLAVNLSDLAAKGAEPAWVTLALTLPEANESWLKAFCSGFFSLANRYNVALIGGDLTRGPLAINIQAMGFTPKNKTIRRSGANVGDLIYVTHTLGDAALGLAFLQNTIAIPVKHQPYAIQRHLHPEPRIDIGNKIRNIATSSIDISDGLYADLSHILENSHVGAVVDIEKLPLSDAMRASVTQDKAIEFALTGGDDYELCFTAPAHHPIPDDCTCIGSITETPGLLLQPDNKKNAVLVKTGYQHF